MDICEFYSLDDQLSEVDPRLRKCKSLTAYASVTTIGDHSWYEVEETETVHGAKLVQRDDYQG